MTLLNNPAQNLNFYWALHIYTLHWIFTLDSTTHRVVTFGLLAAH